MLIEQFPHVLENHFKLWYSSTTVLRKIINYKIEGRSNEFNKEEFKKRLRLYAKSSLFDKAKEVIQESKLLIIVGEPGAGKTTLAELLLYEYIKDDFSLTYIYDDVKEIESVLQDNDEKQIFYYDDFLGHNSLEIAKAKSSENALIKIIKRISSYKNKYLILTTRTLILNAASEESENLRRFKKKIKDSILRVPEYSRSLKQQIIINHIEESQVNNDLKKVLSNQTDYLCNHENFSPRSIEFITSVDQIGKLTPDELKDFIIENFDKPDEIWRHAYEQQINFEERLMLNTLISFGAVCNLRDFETAFNHRLEYEVINNNYFRPINAFNITFKKLLGGFIVPYFSYESLEETMKYGNSEDEIHLYTFINHSLTDFLINYVKRSQDESIRILKSSYFIRQVTNRFFPIYPKKEHLPHLHKELFLDKNDFFIKPETSNSDKCTLALLQNSYLPVDDIKIYFYRNVTGINDWSFLSDDYDLSEYLFKFLSELKDLFIIETVKETLKLLLPSLALSISDIDRLFQLAMQCNLKFNINESTFFNIISCEEVSDHVSSIIQDKFEQEIDDLIDNADDLSFPYETIRNFTELRDKLRIYGFYIDVDYSDFNKVDWTEITIENHLRHVMSKDNS